MLFVTMAASGLTILAMIVNSIRLALQPADPTKEEL